MRALVLLGTVGATLGIGAFAAHVYTDLLWFHELGQERILWATLKWQLLADWFFPLATALALLLNMSVIDRVLIAYSRGAAVSRPVVTLWPFRKLLYPAVAIACGAVVARGHATPGWEQLALWAHGGDFGVTDPLFHRDVGFYVFSLPVHVGVQQWLTLTLLMAAGASAIVYVAAGAVRVGWPPAVARGVRAHVLSIIALLLVMVAWRYQLDRFELALPHDGSPVPGASYTEARVSLPALQAFSCLALVGAALCLVGAARRVPSRLLMTAAATAVLVALAAGSLPGVVDRFGVAPQQLSRERPYLADAIESTRRAWALDRVSVDPVDPGGDLSAGEIVRDRATLDNVSLWDPHVLRASMNELESIGRYYGFQSATVDRYTIAGVQRLMTIGPRTLDVKHLEQSAFGWASRHFAYTHGFGVVGASAAEADRERFPRFSESFGSGPNPLGVVEPRIYFGERSAREPPYVVVNTARAEVEQPIPGSEAPDYHYRGPAGIRLSSVLRRAAFAARFGDLKLLLTETVTPESRIIVHRDARERVRMLAPFMRWDAQPATAVVDGRVKFIFDGYTTSNRYPYSELVRFAGGDVNYARAPAVAVVDGYSGDVDFYVTDPEEPILRAWRGVYPTLFHPAERMSAQLRAHLRYPKRLFAAQAEAYENYHATDVTSFWNGTDAWERPLRVAGPVDKAGEIRFPSPTERVDSDERREKNVVPSGWQMQPEYVLARLPGDDATRFVLTMPFTPRGRHNMVGYLAGDVDDLGRPRLRLLSLPRDQLTVGPAQATRRVLGTPGVSRRIELLNRESRDLGQAAINRTVLGIPRVVPVGGSLLQVQTIYVTSGGSSLPRLQLVTVQMNGHIGYGRNLDSALRQLLREQRRAAS